METIEKSKYDQMLSQYNTALNDSEVAAKVAEIIEKKVPENDTLAVKKFLMGSVELTTLKTTDSEESVLAFTEKVNKFEDAYPELPHVATICVYPCFAKIVSQSLEVEGVEVACVSGSFPSSQALIEIKTVETALALKDGAERGQVPERGLRDALRRDQRAEGNLRGTQDEGHPGDRPSAQRFGHQEGEPAGNVLRRRLHKDKHGQREAGRHA